MIAGKGNFSTSDLKQTKPLIYPEATEQTVALCTRKVGFKRSHELIEQK